MISTLYFSMLSSMIAAKAQEGYTTITLPLPMMEKLTPEETDSFKVRCSSSRCSIPLKGQPSQLVSPWLAATCIAIQEPLICCTLNPLTCVSPYYNHTLHLQTFPPGCAYELQSLPSGSRVYSMLTQPPIVQPTSLQLLLAEAEC